MKTVHIILNEQHTLLKEQEELLNRTFPMGTFRMNMILVPAAGWNQNQQKEIMKGLDETVLFISPVPFMLMTLSKESQVNSFQCPAPTISKVDQVLIMANDTREKKELDNGKIVHVLSKTGWYII